MRPSAPAGDNLDPQTNGFDGPAQPVPETVVGKLEARSTATRHRSQASGIINYVYDFVDYIYDFDPGRVAIRIDGPDIFAAASDHAVEFTAAHLVTPETSVPLPQMTGQMFAGPHDWHPVFRIVLDSSDEAKRYSTEWIQR